jgi:hypothetical protein
MRRGGVLFETLGPGDLCAVELVEGDYFVVKILVMDDGIVHLRLYPDRFSERPFAVHEFELDLAPIHKSFGIPHLPLSAEDFATWRPGVVGHESVRPEELEGYELWRESHEVRSRSRVARP